MERTNADTVEEEGPGIANYPAVLGDTPGGGQHDQTDKHDGRILNQTPTTANPVLKLAWESFHSGSPALQ
jgi:hypothetical protein